MKYPISDTVKTCDSCKIKKKSCTGTEIISKDGLNYKWICKDCADTKERLKNEQRIG